MLREAELQRQNIIVVFCFFLNLNRFLSVCERLVMEAFPLNVPQLFKGIPEVTSSRQRRHYVLSVVMETTLIAFICVGPRSRSPIGSFSFKVFVYCKCCIHSINYRRKTGVQPDVFVTDLHRGFE